MGLWRWFPGPIVAAASMWVCAAMNLPDAAVGTAGLAALCALWWVFEPLPMAVTALLPLALLPLFGVLSADQVGAAYGSPLILLLLGGFMLSQALAHSGAHRRLALAMLHVCGVHSQRRLVFGFMLASAVLSMWISNTATTLMLLPVAMAVLPAQGGSRMAPILVLGIAYAASIGGLGTPIGTPPNLVFMQVYAENVGRPPSFVQWMQWTLPVVVVLLPAAALWLTRRLNGPLRAELPQVGAWQAAERRTLWVFALVALLWVSRSEPWGGWQQWLQLPQAHDAHVALLGVVLLSAIGDGRGGRLLPWSQAVAIPWGVLILFGGGIALAKAFAVSGLSEALGDALAMVGVWPLWSAVIVICLMLTFLTEVSSNTATAVLLLPVLALAAQSAQIPPLWLMLPAALSASCAFMLPVATAPNAIVYGSGQVSATRMAREGLALNLMGALIITALTVFWIVPSTY
nr:SLC13/DASS family transporter [Oceanococcus sp. HetDA_MAG_MS8]